MKKNKLSLFLLPLLLTSCVTDSGKEESGFASAESSEISLSSSYDFGSDPTSTYQRESAEFISILDRFDYRVTILLPNGDRGLWGPSIGLHFGDSWVDVEVVGQEDITAGVKGSSTRMPAHAYNDYNRTARAGDNRPSYASSRIQKTISMRSTDMLWLPFTQRETLLMPQARKQASTTKNTRASPLAPFGSTGKPNRWGMASHSLRSMANTRTLT